MIQVRVPLESEILFFFVLLLRLYRSTIGVARALPDLSVHCELYPGTKGPTLVRCKTGVKVFVE